MMSPRHGQSGSSLGYRGSNNGASCPSQRRTSHGDRVSFGGVREESPRALQQEMEQEQEQVQPVPRDLAEVSASELSEGVGIGPISPLTRVHVPVIEEAAAVEVAALGWRLRYGGLRAHCCASGLLRGGCHAAGWRLAVCRQRPTRYSHHLWSEDALVA